MYIGAILLAQSVFDEPLAAKIATSWSTVTSVYPIMEVAFVIGCVLTGYDTVFITSFTVTVVVAGDDTSPSSSVTVRETVYSPVSS